jgi:hypothetical protein
MALERVGVIKRYFEREPHGRAVTLAELKALTTEERQELAELSARELGLKEVEPGKYE